MKHLLQFCGRRADSYVICEMAKILIADDSRFQVQMLAGWLKGRGFETITAADALQAWMTALRALPDAILLDINMPAGSGVQVLRRLRNSAKTQHIPVIIITGSDEPDTMKVVEKLGAAAFLHKPVEEKTLCDMIALVLPKH
jgi:twitching motility two-component system response regulator PilH